MTATITISEAVAKQVEQQMIQDVEHPLDGAPLLSVIRSAQTRINIIRSVDQEIIETLDQLDAKRRALKKLSLDLVAAGLVEGSNEKQREAFLARLLEDDSEYQELLNQERELHRKHRELEADRDCLRRMHHLELALIQGEAKL